ncbi:heparin lyase I family protein [Gephyromycinifex aptenodytis]|uniref:heparin lyase I family protein n=1 Tax=Gephyromycinifex aptenodytis TaxID=2716227 RepID=UPI001447A7F5|nr:heparin lyase I family protein [Gephyromycinifex aptenodytis]
MFTAVLAGCAAPAPPPDPEPRPPLSLECTKTQDEVETVTENGASQPICVRGAWVFIAPALENPQRMRRSEIFLRNGSEPVTGREGSVIVHDVELSVRLGESGASDDAWHVLWQLHGPTDGQWRPPPVALHVRNGRLGLSGGAGHPNHSWKQANHEWSKPLIPISDGETHRVRIVVVLSSDPRKGSVSASVDGRSVLEQWRPRSPDGYTPGTLYPGQHQVSSRIGLYRGSQSETPPEYEQIVVQRVLEATGH